MLAAMKHRERCRNIKVFILTVSNDPADKRLAAELGISGFITKPLKLESPSTSDVFNLMMDLMNA
jgi:CheY-like chemotaxis protein